MKFDTHRYIKRNRNYITNYMSLTTKLDKLDKYDRYILAKYIRVDGSAYFLNKGDDGFYDMVDDMVDDLLAGLLG